MLERKRQVKSYTAVPGGEPDLDVELGEGVGPQETGVTYDAPAPASAPAPAPTQTLEQEVDNWDENADDWEEDDSSPVTGEDQKTPASSTDEPVDPKKRHD